MGMLATSWPLVLPAIAAALGKEVFGAGGVLGPASQADVTSRFIENKIPEYGGTADSAVAWAANTISSNLPRVGRDIVDSTTLTADRLLSWIADARGAYNVLQPNASKTFDEMVAARIPTEWAQLQDLLKRPTWADNPNINLQNLQAQTDPIRASIVASGGIDPGPYYDPWAGSTMASAPGMYYESH